VKGKATCRITQALLLIGMVTLSFYIQPVKAELMAINFLDPVINPKPGQYVHYVVNCHYEDGTVLWSGWWNFSYIDYLTADLINATHSILVAGQNGTFWLAINLTDRWIPYGSHWWVDSWYVPWIETNITLGSVIKMWKTNGTVIGTAVSRIRLNGHETSIDCWKVQFSELGDPPITYTFLFDKQSGVGIEGITSYEPYIKFTLISTNIPIGTPLSVTVDVNPNTLNLRNKGKWVTAYIELPESYNINDINVSTIMLNGTVPPELRPRAIGDYDYDGVPDLMVKFDSAKLTKYILANVDIEERFMTITLTISGELNDGTPFQGSCTIKIIHTMPWRTFRFERYLEHLEIFPM